MSYSISLTVNGDQRRVELDDPRVTLLDLLRERLDLTGTKKGCDRGQCGACTVLVDGQATRSCVTPVETVTGTEIMTIEAVEADPVGRKVVEAWVGQQVPQCGYCQSGQVMAATALLKQSAHPTEEEIAGAMINLCRCGTYNAIAAAVREAAQA